MMTQAQHSERLNTPSLFALRVFSLGLKPLQFLGAGILLSATLAAWAALSALLAYFPAHLVSREPALVASIYFAAFIATLRPWSNILGIMIDSAINPLLTFSLYRWTEDRLDMLTEQRRSYAHRVRATRVFLNVATLALMLVQTLISGAVVLFMGLLWVAALAFAAALCQSHYKFGTEGLEVCVVTIALLSGPAAVLLINWVLGYVLIIETFNLSDYVRSKKQARAIRAASSAAAEARETARILFMQSRVE